MEIVGYTDRLSVRQGEKLKVMVSCEAPSYEASLVRLIHGDANPLGPGLKERPIETFAKRKYPGRKQHLYLGSYIRAPASPKFDFHDGFTLQAWIYPTTPTKGEQGVLTKWDDAGAGGYGLFVSSSGEVSACIRGANGTTHRVASGAPLLPRTWYFVAATYDARAGVLQVWQEPVVRWPGDVMSRRELKISVKAGVTDCPFLIAAKWREGDPAVKASRIGGLFNGRIDRPRTFARPLTFTEIEALRDSGDMPESARTALTADWNFSLEPASNRAVDEFPNGLHGIVVNCPGRALPGRNWTGAEVEFSKLPAEYGAIHFHDDDLDDAGWNCDFVFDVPADLPSGVYAMKLETGRRFDYVPFFVRPTHSAQAKILFLAPSFSYMAYGNEHLPSRPGRTEKLAGMSLDQLLATGSQYEQDLFRYMADNNLTSLYEAHTDGSGVAYTTRLRPLANMRPLYGKPIFRFKYTHQFNEDLYLVDWLTEMGHAFDVATDEDLHFEGCELLSQYRVILDRNHREYWTTPMQAALESYLRAGGRIMYLGGNGFYWVTSVDPKRPHLIEVRRTEAGVRTWQTEPGEHYHSTTGEYGGLWRIRSTPPQKVVGVGTTAIGGEPARPYRRTPASHDPRAAFIFEGVVEDILGDFGLHLGGAAGWEIDRADIALGTPAHALVVASSFGHSDDYQLAIEDLWKTDPTVGGTRNPGVRADMVYFEYPNGGAAFSVGSISYCGSLSHNSYKNNISRLTDNVLRAFTAEKIPGALDSGGQPASPKQAKG